MLSNKKRLTKQLHRLAQLTHLSGQANRLDQRGQFSQANMLDRQIKKLAIDPEFDEYLDDEERDAGIVNTMQQAKVSLEDSRVDKNFAVAKTIAECMGAKVSYNSEDNFLIKTDEFMVFVELTSEFRGPAQIEIVADRHGKTWKSWKLPDIDSKSEKDLQNKAYSICDEIMIGREMPGLANLSKTLSDFEERKKSEM